ncbi:tRNA 5-methoxyuridine(34)/uridine 5-oxyacetic acid(34) synthase CmoB [Trichloromonas sp.]|uniref:tRNA 5-methoxyuridine(34)/uridine 5-oxyacetic acid(34) synthase CmoB n=1 Tax=Trichloromonas sp. TaxID=3069249 RepID=UPI002A47AD21|nr:tRNA 5-methoxyuridine(34)/uridine 5-oxyacetic acid(34) synthase CmoB [Trichloromonas sp.]
MERLPAQADRLGLGPWREALAELIAARTRMIAGDGKGRRYLANEAGLPEVTPSSFDLAGDRVRIGSAADLAPGQEATLRSALETLQPWRKGPFNLFGIEFDSEWDSSLKWNRLAGHIAPLAGRRVLDIGSSNGYYLLRMAAHKPQLALGVEPYLTYFFQFQLLQHYARRPELFTLPVTFEELPVLEGYFDTVFSMGVLSHRRSPLDTLAAMRRVLRGDGQLVLETLVLPGDDERVLCPDGRYAKMNNVYFLPTVRVLFGWLRRCGFKDGRCIDVSLTTATEQRATPWVGTESLTDFLDPLDPGRTVEGYPAPRRAILLAEAR